MTPPLTPDPLVALCEKVLELDATATPGPWIDNGYSRIEATPLIQIDDDWTGPMDRPSGPGYAQPYYEQALATVAHVPAEYGDTATGRHQVDLGLITEFRTAAPDLARHVLRLSQENERLAEERNRILNQTTKLLDVERRRWYAALDVEDGFAPEVVGARIKTEIQRLRDSLQAAETLMAAMDDYQCHNTNCYSVSSGGGGGKCTCGLNAISEKLQSFLAPAPPETGQ